MLARTRGCASRASAAPQLPPQRRDDRLALVPQLLAETGLERLQLPLELHFSLLVDLRLICALVSSRRHPRTDVQRKNSQIRACLESDVR